MKNMISERSIRLTLALVIATLSLASTGCSTTHEFKPTASVMVGAHKSI